MTKQTAPVNYTAEQTAELVRIYTASPTRETAEALAVQFGRTFRSVVAKLTRENVYKKAEAVGKDGKPVVTKEDLATELAGYAGLNEEEAASLTKATKQALLKLLDVVRPVDEDEAEEEASAA